MAPRPPAYLIFAGLPDGPAVWLEAVYGLEHAKRRILEMAAQRPGTYFIRDMELVVLGGVNMTPEPSRPLQAGRTSKGTAA